MFLLRYDTMRPLHPVDASTHTPQAYLEALPSAPMYERSYMHRDVVTHAVMTPCGTDFLVTASSDGHVKFWKKMPEGVEFVKHYHSHLEPIHDLAVSHQI